MPRYAGWKKTQEYPWGDVTWQAYDPVTGEQVAEVEIAASEGGSEFRVYRHSAYRDHHKGAFTVRTKREALLMARTYMKEHPYGRRPEEATTDRFE